MIQHLESHLGELQYGWSAEKSSLQVVLFKNQPFSGISTYSTLGLSNHVLTLSDTKEVRQELIFSVYEQYESERIAASLISFGEHIIDTKKALLRGEIVGPGNPFIENTKIVGVYASIPAFFEDSFYVYEQLSPPVVIVWLIPLLANEIEYVKKLGWENFEERLETTNGNFWDINRRTFL